jgi:drug/metabolite transporter (DMT)-like permease
LPLPPLPAPLAGMLLTVASGLQFSLLNAVMREQSMVLDEFQTQFLRYGFGLVVMLPFLLRDGLATYRPNGLGGQMWRGVVHTAGLLLWFAALPHIPLADTTAIGFATPLFIMLGAVVFLKEPLRRRRWIAGLVGFAGVLVILWPRLSGSGGLYHLLMVCSVPLFAASFLITKALTRRDSSSVIVVWQSLTVAVFTLPFALPGWVPLEPAHYAWFLLAGLLGSGGHYCLTQAFRLAEISALQPMRFLDLIWASALGFLLFGDVPPAATLLGAVVIFGAATVMARAETRATPPAARP